VPGELRRKDVAVGAHIAVSPGAVPRFLRRFEEIYGAVNKTKSILSAAAAHHRLVWIHPFVDRNGRVARLMSHTTMLNTLDTGAIWSVAAALRAVSMSTRDTLRPVTPRAATILTAVGI
jgi:Fic family protein